MILQGHAGYIVSLLVSCTDEDDLHDVITLLKGVVTKWKAIGTAFRLKQSKLREIQVANHGNPEDCLRSVLDNWLNRNYNVTKFGEPSWRRVVEVVADPAAGDNVVLARSIATAHSCKFIV